MSQSFPLFGTPEAPTAVSGYVSRPLNGGSISKQEENHMKRWTVLLLAGILASAFVVGCKGDDGASTGTPESKTRETAGDAGAATPGDAGAGAPETKTGT